MATEDVGFQCQSWNAATLCRSPQNSAEWGYRIALTLNLNFNRDFFACSLVILIFRPKKCIENGLNQLSGGFLQDSNFDPTPPLPWKPCCPVVVTLVRKSTRKLRCRLQCFPSVVVIPVLPFWKKVPLKLPGRPENSGRSNTSRMRSHPFTTTTGVRPIKMEKMSPCFLARSVKDLLRFFTSR